MGWQPLVGFAAGLLIAVVTTPVGVSGAVFLLPVQIDLLHVPSPQVTPTNLLFNVIAVPGALGRYHRQGQLTGPLTRQLITGTLPGVILGAVIRVHLLPGITVFRILLAALLGPLGLLILLRHPKPRPRQLTSRTILALAFTAGLLGGIYGIGGGSLLSPILVIYGLPLTTVAPAALASTFLTSLAGAATYALLALTAPGPIAPHWTLGAVCGLGGLLSGYLGARIQPHIPRTTLRIALATIAIALAASYLLRSL